eukprot:1145018-Pelagomonas_calceolata.AAC.3
MARLGVGSIDSFTHTQEDCVESDLSTLKSPVIGDMNATVRASDCTSNTIYRADRKRKRIGYSSQVQLRALRKCPLTSKLAKASPRRFTGPA